MAWPSFLDGIPSIRKLAGLAAGSQVFLAPEQQDVLRESSFSSCPNAQLSCRNSSVVENLCCFNAPGGQISATQFWNSDPSQSRYDYLGPADSWTIHGLWPDHCDGTYDSSCDPSRVYAAIGPLLKSFGREDLVEFMSKYWKGIEGDEHLWVHEWSKHGTCVSTLEPKCYDNYKRGEEVVDYFQRAKDVFEQLPSYQWLANASIVPSEDRTYSLNEIRAALTAPRGHPPVIACDHGELREIWYHFLVRGSLQAGDFVPVDPDWSGVRGSPLPRNKQCPSTGIKYLPKKKGTSTTTTATTTRHHAPTGTSAPFSGKGFLKVYTEERSTGCLITSGRWYASGGCATFSATKQDDGFTLSTRRGDCALYQGKLACNTRVQQPTVFTNVNETLSVDGERTTFYAAEFPHGTKQEPIYVSEHPIELEIVWAQH